MQLLQRLQAVGLRNCEFYRDDRGLPSKSAANFAPTTIHGYRVLVEAQGVPLARSIAAFGAAVAVGRKDVEFLLLVERNVGTRPKAGGLAVRQHLPWAGHALRTRSARVGRVRGSGASSPSARKAWRTPYGSTRAQPSRGLARKRYGPQSSATPAAAQLKADGFAAGACRAASRAHCRPRPPSSHTAPRPPAAAAQELWRAATITDETIDADGKQMCTCLTCDDDAQVEVVVDRAELLLRDVLPPEGVDDLVSLGNLHAPAILDNLRLRFMRPAPDTGRHKSIYTYCGNICIAINPYERLAHLTSQECKDSYINQESFSDNPPHIYAVAEAAYSNMMRSSSTEVRHPALRCVLARALAPCCGHVDLAGPS